MTSAHRTLAPWKTRCIDGYIAATLHSTLRVMDLAKAAQCGRTRLKRAFKESFGCTPHQYVLRRRIERAQRLMLISNDPLHQIAAECGFAGQSHLCHRFRQAVGQPLRTWRRLHATRPTGSGPIDDTPYRPIGEVTQRERICKQIAGARVDPSEARALVGRSSP